MFKKVMFALFAVLQLGFVQGYAETTSHIAYASGWTGNGIAEGINTQLVLAQNENKFFELAEISITPEWGYAYILYKLSDERESNPLFTQVAYVSAWTGDGLAIELQNKINLLQNNAKNENKLINILDIKITPEWGFAYIIYEISK